MTDAARLERLRYPLGKFAFPENLRAELATHLGQIAEAPAGLRRAVRRLDDDQLDTPYRPGGWTVRQVVHHLADSHLNSYLRLKLAATEERPTVKLYDEKLWAELADARSAPVDTSLDLLDALHQRWVIFLGSLDETALERDFLHPDFGPLTIEQNIAIYAWHGRHHLAHVTSLRERRGWS